jgi:DNA-binding NtrC family response regulator
MVNILLVSQEKTVFKKVEAAFSKDKINTQWVDSAQKALSTLSNKKFDLFIISEDLSDMTGRQLIEKALFQDAMMNSVVLSQLSHKDFHEAYEGFGVLMQFPLEPEMQDVANLMDHLDRINKIAGKTNSVKGEKN